MTSIELSLRYRATKALRPFREAPGYCCGYAPEANLVWFINPKCAQTTINASLQSAYSGFLRIDRPYHQIVGTEQWRSFGFVRNPVTRFTSLWKDKVRNWSPTNNPLSLDVARRDYLLNIDNFIDFLASLDLNSSEVHTRKQVQLVPPGIAQEIGHVESFEQDWNRITKKLGFVAPALSSLNATLGDVALEQKQVNKIKQLYKDDFQAFGYE